MKTIVYVGTSLDGYIARADGEFGWLSQFANDEAISAYKELIDRIDVIVIGRGTFEKVLTFPSWPYDKKVFVLSTSIKEAPVALREKVTILALEPGALVRYLSGMGYSSIYVDGGKVIQAFLKEDLINELIISKAPVLIGSGIALFGSLNRDLEFTHIKTDVCSNGLVRSYYERK
jgi:dihydrofolate reductase